MSAIANLQTAGRPSSAGYQTYLQDGSGEFCDEGRRMKNGRFERLPHLALTLCT
jgi:hypothetical protein